jgi:hypothetical protein
VGSRGRLLRQRGDVRESKLASVRDPAGSRDATTTAEGWLLSPGLNWLPVILAGIPPIVVARDVIRYGQNVPYWDQWELVPLLAADADGSLTFASLWAQHNEHRFLLPRLLMIGLARLTSWDVRAEMVASLLIATATLALLVDLLRLSLRPVAPRAVPWVAVLLSALIFSLSQWENWTWGWQMGVFMNVLGAVSVAWALGRFGLRRIAIVGMLLGSGLAIFSFASGLTLVVLVPLAILTVPNPAAPRVRLERAALTLMVGGALATAYLHGYVKPGHHPSVFVAEEEPVSYVRYVLTYLGAPLASWNATWAAVWGTAGVLGVAIGIASVWRREAQFRSAAFPWLFLATYVLATALITGLGRLGFGVAEALSARYITITSLLWIALAVLITLALSPAFADPKLPRRYGYALFGSALILLTLAGVGYIGSAMEGRQAMESRRDRLRAAAKCILAPNPPDICLTLMYSVTETVRGGAGTLRRLGLGPFRARRATN